MTAIRYFKDPLAMWKFEHSQPPQIKTAILHDWIDSTFASLEEFLDDLGEVVEITAEEAEEILACRSELRCYHVLSGDDGLNLPFAVVHSEHDWRCPIEQAQRMFVALRRRGVEAEMLIFPGEDHELTRAGQPRHRIERFAAVLDWWERHLPAS